MADSYSAAPRQLRQNTPSPSRPLRVQCPRQGERFHAPKRTGLETRPITMELLPYVVQPRQDTGLYNAKVGIWLFLASEVMLFGALFSSYILLRVGSAGGY